MAKTKQALAKQPIVLTSGKTVTVGRRDGQSATIDVAQVQRNPNSAYPPTGDADFVITT